MKKALLLIFMLLMAICALASCGGHEHSFGEWSVTQNATCTEDGVKTRYCDCGEKQTDVMPATGHNHVDGVCANCGDIQESPECKHKNLDILAAKDPTCTESGLTEGIICLDCEKTIKEQETVNILGHDEYTYTEKDENCKLFTVIACERADCDYIRCIDTGKAEHTRGEAVTENNVSSTCYREGSYETVIYCTECGAELERAKHTVSMVAHTPASAVDENITDSTCYAEGKKDLVVYCLVSECYAELERKSVAIEKKAHTPAAAVEENRVEPTYEADGSYEMVVYCSVSECHAELERTKHTIDQLVHHPGEAVKENIVSATCTKEGSYDEVVYCLDDHCGHKELSRKTITTEKLPHTEADAVTENEVAPTCYSEGSYDSVVYCTVCKVELSRSKVVVPKIEHTPSEVVVENRVDATCTVDGNYDGVVYCSISECKAELSRTTKAIPAKGHTLGAEATCTTAQICTVCKVTITPVLGHDWKEETCTEPKTCKRADCGATDGKAKGHTPGADATCTTAQTCTDCPQIITSALDHDWKEATCTEPKTCKRADCGATDGKAKGHTPGAEATCTTAQTCTKCSEIITHILGHNYVGDVCDRCGGKLVSGLYDENYNLLASWDTLVNTYGLKVNINYKSSNYETTELSPYYILNNYPELSSARNLVIGNGVTFIGDYAFYGCTSLTAVVIPDSVTSIGDYAFYDCTSLTAVVIPDSVTSIGDFAFCWCTNITSVVIGDRVTSIGQTAFGSCTSLTSVVISDSVISISLGAFHDCTSLTSVVIPDSVASIGDGVFYGCTLLKNISVSADNINYKDIDGNLYTKDGKTLIQYAIGKKDTEFVIPDSVTSINDDAFRFCTSLTSVVIPDSVTSIGDYAFYNCNRLTSVVIPDSVTSIGDYAFERCSKLKFNEYENGKYLGSNDNPYFALIKVTTYDFASYTIHKNTKVITDQVFSRCFSLTSIVIPDGVTSIGDRTFNDCTSLTSVVIPNGVTSIGDSAFSDCTSLTSVVIPDSVTIIGDWAFNYCTSLTSVKIGDNVTSIGYEAFSKCISLASVIIGNSVTYISDDMFAGCSNLTSVKIGDSVTSIDCEAFYGCSNLQFNEYENCKYLGSEDNPYFALIRVTTWDLDRYTIHENTKVIADKAFQSCTSLTSVVIPDSVTSIGDLAFCACDSLTSVVIGNGVAFIGERAFYSCGTLKNISVSAGNANYKDIDGNLYTKDGKTIVQYSGGKTDTKYVIPDSVTSVGDWAVAGCSNLTSVVISDSVTHIGDSAFFDCESLKNISVSAGNANYKDIDGNLYTKDGKTLIQYAIGKIDKSFVISDSVTSIGDYAFYNCNRLTSVVIGDGVTSIGYGAFWSCTSLTSVKIGDRVTFIDSSAFIYCYRITSVVIGDSITFIGYEAFYNCASIKDVYYTGSEEEWKAITIISYGNSYLTNATIHYNYVPEE